MKRRISPITAAMALCCFVSLLLSLFIFREPAATVSGRAVLAAPIIIDAGHGGEDGGAVSTDGTVRESNINLAVSLRLCELLRFLGCEVLPTRTEDVSLHSPKATTLRQKKNSDLKNRVALVNRYPDAVLVSIHQNMLPSYPQVHGAQVFYGKTAGSEVYAQSIQETLNAAINPGNEKQQKAMDPSIYLIKKAQCPAVLIECGFLSNGNETEKLQDASYQRLLAAVVAAGLLNAEVTT